MKFSIVIPSYNQGRFLKQAIDSVLVQSGVEKEIIVIDGGSTDETIDVLASYGEKVKWISEKDKGQTDAINKGLKKATGDIIAYLNSDDYYLQGCFEIVAKAFENNPKTMWLTGDGIIVDENGKVIQKFISLYKKFLREQPFFSMIYITNFIIQPSTFWRRKILEEIGFFDETKTYTMDYDYWLRIIKYGYKPLILSEKLSAFRIHKASKGGSKYLLQFSEDYRTLKANCKNPFFRFFHWLHNKLIVLIYFFVK